MTRTLATICFALAVSLPMFAADWYQIEVIAFEHLDPDEKDLELWATHPGEPNWGNSLVLLDPAQAKILKEQLKETRQAAKQAVEVEALQDKAEDLAEEQLSGEALFTVEDEIDLPEPGEAQAQYDKAVKNDSRDFVTVEEIVTGVRQPPSTKTAQEKHAAETGELPFVALPSRDYTLTGVIKKMQEQGTYRILAHTAWRQPALGGKATESIRLSGGNAISGQYPEFEGLFTLKRSKYLHFDTDIVLREKADTSVSGSYASARELGLVDNESRHSQSAKNYQVYRLEQSQRVRPNKIYYFDHPMMGVIVKISPYNTD